MNKNTMVRAAEIVFYCLLVILLLVIVVPAIAYAPATYKSEETVAPTIIATTAPPTVETEPLLISEPILYEDVGYEEPLTYWGAVDHQDAIYYYIAELEHAYNSGQYTEEAMAAMWDEIGRLELCVRSFQVDIDRFLRWESEYPYATKVWYFLRTRGYSKEVSAGIIGNMMVETSGGTLALNPMIYSSSRAYYGLCQWSLYYKPEVRDISIEHQLDYLHNDMPIEFKTFGSCYRKGFTYEDFLELETPEDAAYAFAKVYERCAPGSYELRKQAAREAYTYFTNEE